MSTLICDSRTPQQASGFDALAEVTLHLLMMLMVGHCCLAKVATLKVALKTCCKQVETFYVCASDYYRVSQSEWRLRSGYPNSVKAGALPAFIIGTRPANIPEDYVIDHANRDKLDNTRGNLRWVSRSFNAWNVNPSAHSSSRFNGVTWHKTGKKWAAQALGTYIGLFTDEREAGLAAAKVLIQEFGDWAATSDLIVGPGLFTEDEINDLRVELETSDVVFAPQSKLPKGVSFDPKKRRYIAQFRKKYLGTFTSVVEAKKCYDTAVKAAHEQEWAEHVAHGIPRDQDGDAVIALSASGKGMFSKVPDRFYHILTFKRSWCLDIKYAKGSWPGYKSVRLHQVIWQLLHPGMKMGKNQSIDHIKPEETLNNLESNLRLATRSEQMRNQVKREGTTSKYKNVCYLKARKQWQAKVRDLSGIEHTLLCPSELDAVLAVNKMRLKYLGPSADLLEADAETRMDAEHQRAQNKRRDLTSRYVGVCYDKKFGRWIACVQLDQKQYRKICRTELEAAHAVNALRLQHLGPYAELLEIEEEEAACTLG